MPLSDIIAEYFSEKFEAEKVFEYETVLWSLCVRLWELNQKIFNQRISLLGQRTRAEAASHAAHVCDSLLINEIYIHFYKLILFIFKYFFEKNKI